MPLNRRSNVCLGLCATVCNLGVALQMDVHHAALLCAWYNDVDTFKELQRTYELNERVSWHTKLCFLSPTPRLHSDCGPDHDTADMLSASHVAAAAGSIDMLQYLHERGVPTLIYDSVSGCLLWPPFREFSASPRSYIGMIIVTICRTIKEYLCTPSAWDIWMPRNSW